MQPTNQLPPSSSEHRSPEAVGCEREPIHIPGGIQPHGFYVALHAQERMIVQVSANVRDWTGMDPRDLLGQPLHAVIGQDNAAQMVAAMQATPPATPAIYLGTVSLAGDAYFDVLAHSSQGLTIIEFESVSRQAHADFREFYRLVGSFLGKLNHVESVSQLSEVAAREIKRLSGFGRVLVYRFDHEGHGHVLAEARDPEYHSYTGQRFPASDVPSQARELYVANRVRIIADANYVPSPLVPPQNPLTGEPTDLTWSALRSVSPVHVRYMQNMGTMASMSVSIVIKGKLWGLISCHNTDARTVPVEARTACEQLAQVLALRIESREDSEEFQARLELRRSLVAMLGQLSQGDNFIASLQSIAHDVLRFARASGAVLMTGGEIVRFGDTPDDEAVSALVEWLSVNAGEVYHTDVLSTVYPPAQSFKDCGAGILALSISAIHRDFLIWFRPEVIQTIEWAGNPNLKSDSTTPVNPLSPRMSFDIWRERVEASSAPWTASETEVAGEFRAALLGLVLERAEQMAELADELGRANKELEAFSYSVSHDLRAPMRHIVGYSDLLLEIEGANLNERSRRFLTNIKDSARLAGKLVDDLLSFSQMGRAALRPTGIDMQQMVKATIARLKEQEQGARQVEWVVTDSLPAMEGDPALLQPAIYNLLSNALKYSRTRELAVITVSGERTPTENIFRVHDNGVGFSMEFAHKLFGVFQRLHRMEDFEGTGIGLANVRRIVERHGGRVWADGAPDQGATFSFALPRHIELH